MNVKGAVAQRKERMADNYGKMVIIDLHQCNVARFNRTDIEQYFVELAEKIDMKRCDLHWWDDKDVPEEQKQVLPHTKGTTGVQFILTSHILVHTLEILERAYIDIFSCKDFSDEVAVEYTKQYFGGVIAQWQPIKRI